MECKSCHKHNIPIFSWLAGQNYCEECSTPKPDFIRDYILQKNKDKKKEKSVLSHTSQEDQVKTILVALIFFGLLYFFFSISSVAPGGQTSDGNINNCFYVYGTPGYTDCY